LSPEGWKPRGVSCGRGLLRRPSPQGNAGRRGDATKGWLLHAGTRAWSLVPVRQENAWVFKRRAAARGTQTSRLAVTPIDERFVARRGLRFPPCECPDIDHARKRAVLEACCRRGWWEICVLLHSCKIDFPGFVIVDPLFLFSRIPVIGVWSERLNHDSVACRQCC